MKAVAVIGASNDRRKFGNKAVRGYLQQGYTVFPINSQEAEVEGIPAYTSVLEVPQPIDMATLYLAPGDGITVLAEIAKKGIPEVWVNPGAESPALVQRARELGIEPIIACSLMAIGEMPGDG